MHALPEDIAKYRGRYDAGLMPNLFGIRYCLLGDMRHPCPDIDLPGAIVGEDCAKHLHWVQSMPCV
ncbi:MAG: hypothetical protein WCK86_06845, partial [Planctomycetia bacterium]